MVLALHIFFLTFHIALILFNCFGWLWPRARRIHLISLGITWASWILLGIKYGFGYCPLTDWHWDILHRLGKTDLPPSYMKYLADTVTGLDVNAGLIDGLTVVGLVMATMIAVYLRIKGKG